MLGHQQPSGRVLQLLRHRRRTLRGVVPLSQLRLAHSGIVTVLRPVHASSELVQERAHGEFVCTSSPFAASRALPLRGLHRGHRRELAVRRFDCLHLQGDAAPTKLRDEGIPQQLQGILHCVPEVFFQRGIHRIMGPLRSAHRSQSLLSFVPSFAEM